MSTQTKLTEAQVEEAAAAAKAGRSIRSLARELGVHHKTLRDRIHRLQQAPPDEPAFTEVPVFFRDYSDRDHLYVYPMGDVHLGSSMHAAGKWRQWMEYLEHEPRASMLATGDMFNAAIVGSKSDVYSEQMTLQEAKRELRTDLRQLAEDGRLDGLVRGNHEDRIWRAVGLDPLEDLAEDLDVPYAPFAGMWVYRVGDVEYEIYFRHGTGNGQSAAQLEKSSGVALADVYVTGHIHKPIVLSDNYFAREGDHLVRRRRVYVSSGSFLAYEGYAASRGYKPSRLGAPRIYLDGRQRDVHASI